MKSRPLKVLAIIALVSSRSLLAQTPAPDTDEPAVAAALRWLALADEARWSVAWDSTADALKRTTSFEEWTSVLQSSARIVGNLVSRDLYRTDYTVERPGTPTDQYVLVQFISRFEMVDSVMESIEEVLEDSLWKVVGYYLNFRMELTPADNDSTETWVDQAASVAESWLQLIDQGLYEEAWNAAADTFKRTVPIESWLGSREEQRDVLGVPKSRLVRETRNPQQGPALVGRPIVVYVTDSVFQKSDPQGNPMITIQLNEVVILLRDQDGRWKPIFYSVQAPQRE